MEKLKVLDLFSGIGGFSLGLERTGGFETVAFCEIDPFCQKVLKKHWPDVPIYNDVRTLNYDGPVDVITGGYPCQPFSYAGNRKGEEDDRHLWPAMFGLIEKYKPDWVIGENVIGHITMGLDSVLDDLEGIGYAARTFVIPACAIGAPHRRDRTWVVANSGRKPRTLAVQSPKYDFKELNGGKKKWRKNRFFPEMASLRDSVLQKWMDKSKANRMDDGVSDWPYRLKACGNAVVPDIPERLGYAILNIYNFLI
jgi:DNA (cytosine-5)-methyltransferase 1